MDSFRDIWNIVRLLLGIYKRHDDIYVFLLLEIFYNYNNGFDGVLLEYLHGLSIEPNTAEELSNFSLKTLKQIDPRPLKRILENTDQKPQIPFPILGDPFVKIELDFIWEESTTYEFKLFKFYLNVNRKRES